MENLYYIRLTFPISAELSLVLLEQKHKIARKYLFPFAKFFCGPERVQCISWIIFQISFQTANHHVPVDTPTYIKDCVVGTQITSFYKAGSWWHPHFERNHERKMITTNPFYGESKEPRKEKSPEAAFLFWNCHSKCFTSFQQPKIQKESKVSDTNYHEHFSTSLADKAAETLGSHWFADLYHLLQNLTLTLAL